MGVETCRKSRSAASNRVRVAGGCCALSLLWVGRRWWARLIWAQTLYNGSRPSRLRLQELSSRFVLDFTMAAMWPFLQVLPHVIHS
jgi:hypothetical protein